MSILFVLGTIVMNLCSCPRSLYSWGKIETIDRTRSVERPPSCYELRQLACRSKLQIFALVARPNCWTDSMFATKLWSVELYSQAICVDHTKLRRIYKHVFLFPSGFQLVKGGKQTFQTLPILPPANKVAGR